MNNIFKSLLPKNVLYLPKLLNLISKIETFRMRYNMLKQRSFYLKVPLVIFIWLFKFIRNV